MSLLLEVMEQASTIGHASDDPLSNSHKMIHVLS